MSSKGIFRAISLVSLGTLVARICGLGREVATANFFGTSGIYDAFLIAFMIPNFFRGLLAEGALNAAFIPILSEYEASGRDGKECTEIFRVSYTISLLATLLLYSVVLLVSFGMTTFFVQSGKWAWVWTLLRFTFPYLIFISVTALNIGVLNVRKSFLIPAFSPVILDIFWVASLFLLLPVLGTSLEDRIYGLCIGVLVGGFGQFLFTLVPAIRQGYTPKLSFNFGHPAVRKMGKLLAPVVIGMAVGPVNLLLDYSMAGTLFDGAVSSLWYGTRIYQLPLGIFAISISTVLLPWFSENISSKDFTGFEKNLKFGFKLLVMLMVPFTFGMIALRSEIVTLLFSRGLFSGDSVKLVAGPLAYYSIGLAGYGGGALITRAFYSFGDTSTPVKVGVASIMANFLLNLILMSFMKHEGIALSTSLVGTANFFILLGLFRKKHLRVRVKEMIPFFARVSVASIAMFFLLRYYLKLVSGRLSLPAVLFSAIMVGTVFCIACLWTAIKREFGFSLMKRRAR